MLKALLLYVEKYDVYERKARIYSFTTLFQQLNRNFAIEFTNSPAYPTPPQRSAG